MVARSLELKMDNLVLHSDSYPVYEFDKFDIAEFDDLFHFDSIPLAPAGVVFRL
jgi:hypothetical protein